MVWRLLCSRRSGPGSGLSAAGSPQDERAIQILSRGFLLGGVGVAAVPVLAGSAEKTASIKLVHVSSVGRFGRMWLSGSEAEILTAKNAAIEALGSLAGREGA